MSDNNSEVMKKIKEEQDLFTTEEAWQRYVIQCFKDHPEFRYAIVNLFNKV